MSGFPIRTPWDHSLVDSSPRPIAASHVLHRLLVPRHPPFALDNLTYRKQDARVHCAILNQQPTHNPNGLTPNPGAVTGSLKWYVKPGHAWTVPKKQPPDPQAEPVVLSGPNRVLIAFHQPHQQHPFHQHPQKSVAYSDCRPLPVDDSPVSPPVSTPPPHTGSAGYWTTFAV